MRVSVTINHLRESELMKYEDARKFEGKRVVWTWSKGIAPIDSGGAGFVMHVDRTFVKLALVGHAPGRGEWRETRSFPLDEIELSEP